MKILSQLPGILGARHVVTLAAALAFVLAAPSLGVPCMVAQEVPQDEEPKPTEIWAGTLDTESTKLRIQISLIIDEAGNISGYLASPDQTTTRFPIEKITRSKEALAFVISPLGVRYEGSIKDEDTVADGAFVQGPRAYQLVLKKTNQAMTVAHEATWTGQFKVGLQDYDFQFRIFIDNFGGRSAKLDSFTEGIWGIPCQYLVDGSQVTIRNSVTKAEFTGVLNADGRTIAGHWNQRDIQFPLTLNHVPLDATRQARFERPQTPQSPFPYKERHFGVVVKEVDPKFEQDVGIAGTLTSPNAQGQHPTVILISGTGQQDRNHTTFEHQPFLVIADHLTRRGFTVIRYDDRGAGRSVGSTAAATTMTYANDAEAIFRWATTQPEVDPKRVVILGHSEGALIASIIATRQPDVAGIVMLAPTGMSGKEVFLSQSSAIARVNGMPDEVIVMQDRFLQQAILDSRDAATMTPEKFMQSFQGIFGELTEEQRIGYGIFNIAESTFALLSSPWARFFMDYDPRSSLLYVQCPMLSLFGEKDVQSIAQLHAPAIKTAADAGKNPDFEQKVLPGLNHWFQSAQTGSPREYLSIEQTIDPSALDEISIWIGRRFLK